MNLRTLRALIVLNVVLLVALVIAGIAPQPAQAQLTQNEYLMVSGRVAGRSQQSAVYVIKLNTGEIAALMFNSANNDLQILDRRRLYD